MLDSTSRARVWECTILLKSRWNARIVFSIFPFELKQAVIPLNISLLLFLTLARIIPLIPALPLLLILSLLLHLHSSLFILTTLSLLPFPTHHRHPLHPRHPSSSTYSSSSPPLPHLFYFDRICTHEINSDLCSILPATISHRLKSWRTDSCSLHFVTTIIPESQVAGNARKRFYLWVSVDWNCVQLCNSIRHKPTYPWYHASCQRHIFTLPERLSSLFLI